MIELVPLCTLELDLAPSLTVGTGPAGDRNIGEIRSATLSGERLQGSLAGPAAADWLVRTGTIGIIDARMTIRTADGALIYIQYGGRLDLANTGEVMSPKVAPVFETGDERYAWLNGVQAVGKGSLRVGADGARIAYEIFEVR